MDLIKGPGWIPETDQIGSFIFRIAASLVECFIFSPCAGVTKGGPSWGRPYMVDPLNP
jgi:hypothetical protein